ncbi:hypothetical protein ABT026_28045 [Streptomyces sp. NPDC002734]|uniref:hypothetical protein n=1 Tax=Streptomyces sp. NPDC002734 TaxID=3154426 RepID=UPI003327A272
MTKIAGLAETAPSAAYASTSASDSTAATVGAGDTGTRRRRTSAIGRTGRLLTATVLASLLLSACGTGHGSNGSRPADGSAADRPQQAAAAAAGQSAAAPPAAFTRMLDDVARGCPSDPASRKGSLKDHAPEPEETVTPLPEGFVEPRDDSGQPGIELSPYEWCAGHRHVQRVFQEVAAIEEPTPELVRTALNDLGYVDERIVGLERSGGRTHFLLDLRVDGGELCLWGETGGAEPYVELFAETDAEPSFSPDPQWAPQD